MTIASLPASTLIVPPFAVLLLGLVVLLAGEWIVHRSRWLLRSNIPPAIIGGLAAALLLLGFSRVAPGVLALNASTDHPAWLWAILPSLGWVTPPPMDVERPLLILFFTCIGLNASWSLARRGGAALVLYLATAAGVAVLQAALGAGLSAALGQSPLLGVLTGNVALMGGFGTAAGFAAEFEKAGVSGAATLGLTAAAFGVVAGGVLGGLVGARLAEKKLAMQPHGGARPTAGAAKTGWVAEMAELFRSKARVALHLLVLLFCMKAGAFVSVWIQSFGLTFPVYMGSMIVAAALRNTHDAAGGRWLRADVTDAIGSVVLMWLLAVVMIDLQLETLASIGPVLLTLLAAQAVFLAVLAYSAVFRVMGRDYEAAAMSAGMIGFGLGATSNAVATIRVLVQRFGPAPRAFLIVPVVGAFLIDFLNALITTVALNLFR